MPKVLVIDDDPIILRLMTLLLQLDDYIVTTASNVPAAFQHIHVSPPDVICCDLMMPQISGIDFLMSRQDSPELTQIPVIVISGANEPELLNKACELGADTCLEKPFTKGELVSKIEALLPGSDFLASC